MKKLEHIENILNYNQESYVANQQATLRVIGIDSNHIIVDNGKEKFKLNFEDLDHFDILVNIPSKEYIKSLDGCDNVEIQDNLVIIK